MELSEVSLHFSNRFCLNFGLFLWGTQSWAGCLVLRFFWNISFATSPWNNIFFLSIIFSHKFLTLKRWFPAGGYVLKLSSLKFLLLILWCTCQLTVSLLLFFCSLGPFRHRCAVPPSPPAYCCHIFLSCSQLSSSLLFRFCVTLSCHRGARPLLVLLLPSTCLPIRGCMGWWLIHIPLNILAVFGSE